jgi:septal ring factor EnvC (AmiA/AmiB activator)
MNLKRWFAWCCLALVVVAEVALFRAYRESDALSTQLHNTQAELRQTSSELADLKNSAAGLQVADIAKLRRQNQTLTNQLREWRAVAAQYDAENQSNAQHLATARLALRLQGEHLDQVQSESQQIADVSLAVIARKTCINNLRLIDDAKQQWAADLNKPNDVVPTEKDLLPYFKNGALPQCPDGGIYLLNRVDQVPTCSIEGHALPQ